MIAAEASQTFSSALFIKRIQDGVSTVCDVIGHILLAQSAGSEREIFHSLFCTSNLHTLTSLWQVSGGDARLCACYIQHKRFRVEFAAWSWKLLFIYMHMTQWDQNFRSVFTIATYKIWAYLASVLFWSLNASFTGTQKEGVSITLVPPVAHYKYHGFLVGHGDHGGLSRQKNTHIRISKPSWSLTCTNFTAYRLFDQVLFHIIRSSKASVSGCIVVFHQYNKTMGLQLLEIFESKTHKR